MRKYTLVASTWADEDDIVCIHPGGGRVSGVSAIRAAFDAIFSHGGAIQVRPESIRRMDSGWRV